MTGGLPVFVVTHRTARAVPLQFDCLRSTTVAQNQIQTEPRMMTFTKKSYVLL